MQEPTKTGDLIARRLNKIADSVDRRLVGMFVDEPFEFNPCANRNNNVPAVRPVTERLLPEALKGFAKTGHQAQTRQG